MGYEDDLHAEASRFLKVYNNLREKRKLLSKAEVEYENERKNVAALELLLEECVGGNIPHRVFDFPSVVVLVECIGDSAAVQINVLKKIEGGT